MNAEKLQEILTAHISFLSGVKNGKRANLYGANLYGADLHGAYLRGADLRDADLSGANLRDANLRDANLRDADLRGANLRGADLRDADLRDTDLRDANLRDANLRGANLRGANLSDADLRDADLSDADLRDADLRDADLRDADLSDAHLPQYQIRQNGELIVWKRLAGSNVSRGYAKLRIPPEAKRTASLVGRKCRAEYAEVLSIEGASADYEAWRSPYNRDFTYAVGLTVRPDAYDDDPRVECTNGIHFYLTREECDE